MNRYSTTSIHKKKQKVKVKIQFKTFIKIPYIPCGYASSYKCKRKFYIIYLYIFLLKSFNKRPASISTTVRLSIKLLPCKIPLIYLVPKEFRNFVEFLLIGLKILSHAAEEWGRIRMRSKIKGNWRESSPRTTFLTFIQNVSKWVFRIRTFQVRKFLVYSCRIKTQKMWQKGNISKGFQVDRIKKSNLLQDFNFVIFTGSRKATYRNVHKELFLQNYFT